MFKKFLAAISLWAMMGTLMTMPAYAGDIKNPLLIKSVTLSVDPSGSPDTFDPSAGQVLKTAVVLDTAEFGDQLINSSGGIKVVQGTKVIKTLETWVPGESMPANIPTWNGKDTDGSDDSKEICGNDPTVLCPVGSYQILVRVQYAIFDGSGNPTGFIYDEKTANFQIGAVKNVFVSKSPFNPLIETSNISFTTLSAGFVTAKVLDGSTENPDGSNVIKTLISNESLVAGSYSNISAGKAALAWDGKNTAGSLVTNKEYTVKISFRKIANGNDVDSKTATVTVNAPNTILVSAFNLTFSPSKTGGNFDPSKNGDAQIMQIDYTLNLKPDNVQIELKDSKGTIVDSHSSLNISDNFNWNGKSPLLKLVAPGAYTATISASKSGSTTATQTKNFTVAYSNSNKGSINSFSVSPTTFNPAIEDSVIKFTNTADTFVTVEIRNQNDNGVVRTFSSFQNDEIGPNTSNTVTWNGNNESGSTVSTGTYRVVVEARNDWGVVASELPVTVNNVGGSLSSENSQIAGISFSPSYNFDPAKNDQLKIEYDVKQDLSSLKIYAVRGADKIELQNQTTVTHENNVQIEWDGTDTNGDYVDAGSWRIQFESKAGSTSLIAAKSINITYTKPKINDVYLSKSKFDNEQGEFTSVFFRTDIDASVDLILMQDSNEQETITENMQVDGNKWYAVNWDGSGYNFDDNLSIKVVAKNTVNDKVFNTKKISVDLSEDVTSSSKANITQDYIDPVVTNGNLAMNVHYNISANANVKVTIHRGNSSTGTIAASLLDVSDQDSGDHDISWDGKDDNGNKLSNGIYTYKIIASKSSSDTETGIFVVGSMGDVSSIGSGTKEPAKTEDKVVTKSTCASFSDVDMDNEHCEAIKWVKSAGIFSGYSDGSFGVDKKINRVELLKVLIEALSIPTKTASGNLGFTDVISGEWYMKYIQAAKALGIFNGDAGKNTARPNDPSQRVEALKMIFESLKAIGSITDLSGKCINSYTDIPNNVWFTPYACEADVLGLYDKTGGEFGVSTFSTRGEIAEILYRLHLQSLF